MKKPINVLLVEDNEGDAELLKRMLKKGDYVAQCRRVETQEAFTGALDERTWDLILCDYRLPGFSGREALDIYKKREPDFPFIFVSGTMGEEVAVDAMTKGAHDYVMKNNLARLIPAIERELKESKVRIERRQAMEALRASESSMQAILHSTADGILAVSGENKVLYANEQFAQMWKIPQELLSSKDDSVLLQHVLDQLVDPEVFLKRVQELYKSTEDVFDTLNFKDGRAFERLSRPLMDGEVPRGRVWSFRNITERKRSEERLRASEAYHRTLTEAAPDALAIVDTTGALAFASPKVIDMFGIPPEQMIIGKSILTWISPEDHGMIEKRLQEIFIGRWIPGPREVRFLKHDRTLFWGEINSSPIADEAGKTVGLLIVCRDISERKQAEEALRASESRYRSVLQSANDAIVTADSNGNVSGWNRGAERIFGYGYVEVIGQPLTNLMPRDYRSEHIDGLKRFQAGGEPHLVGNTVEMKGVRNDGTEFPMELSLAAWEVPEGHFYTAIIRDITERKCTEAAMRESELRFRSVWNNSADGMRLTDRDGHVMDVNEAYCKLVKMPREELVGRVFSIAYQREGPSDDLGLYQKRFDTRETISNLFGEATLRSGEIVDIEVTSSFIEITGHEKMLLSLFRNVTERKQAEKRIQEERNLLRTIIDAIPDEITVKDTDRRFIVVNNGTVKALKRASPEEILGKRDEDLIPEDVARQAIWEEDAVLAVGGHSKNRIADKIDPETGEIERSIMISKIPLKDGEGKIIGLVGVNRDITELKRTENMLQKERTLLQTLIESIPDEVCLKDLRHRYVVANRASINALRASSLEAMIGKTDRDFVPESYVEQHIAEEDAIVASGEAMINYELTRHNPDTGEIDKCALTTKVPVKDQAGKTIGILVVNRDITDRKKAEEGLRASEEKFRALFEESKDCIYIDAADGKLLDINAAGIELFGYSSKEEALRIDVGRDLYVDRQQRAAFLSRMNQQGFVKDFEATMKRKDGQTLSVLETATAVRDRQGRVAMYRGTIRDVTEQKLLERQIGQAQKMESLGLLSGGIAHDFNNILGIILGHTAVVERAGNNPEVIKDSVGEITTAVQRGASLVRQILTFARKSDATDEPIRVNATVKELGKMIDDTFPKTIALSLHLDKTIPIIMMDPTQLHQALLNLCVNARDAITDSATGNLGRGEIGIRTSCVNNSDVRKKFSEASAREYVCIAVSDTGKGMDEETKQKIFEPFFTTKERGKGTGLGLSVVYGIIKGHHGHIEVESDIGQGTTFRIYLPVTDAVAAPAAHVEDGTTPDIRGKETILLVEDEQNLLGLMKTALERAGYSVLTAMDGLSAIKMFSLNKERIALVLTDLGLPKLDGAAVFTALMDIDPNVKIILASGYLDPNLKSNLLRSGAKEFIQKPYSPNVVLRKIREVLDEKA
jgi:PAS domain S-box-containing protein